MSRLPDTSQQQPDQAQVQAQTRRQRADQNKQKDVKLANVMRNYCEPVASIQIDNRKVDVCDLPTTKVSEQGFTQYTVNGARSLQETRNLVLVLFQTSHSAASKDVVNLIVNYVFGVTFEDDFRFQVTIEGNETIDQCIIAIPRQEDSSVSFNLLLVLAGSVVPSMSYSSLQTVKTAIESEIIDHIDSYIVSFNRSTSKLGVRDLSSLHAPNRDVPLLAFVPDGEFRAFEHKFRSAKLNDVETFGFVYDWKTAEEYDKNTVALSHLFSKVSIESKQFLMTSRVVTEERVQLEDYIIFLYQSMQETFRELTEMRRDIEILEKHKEEILAGQSFSDFYEVSEIVMRPILQTNTFCLQCRVVCHEVCAIENDGEKFGCAAMCRMPEDPLGAFCSFGQCVGVPNGCHWTQHKNLKQMETQTVIKKAYTSKQLAKKYNWNPNNLHGLKEYLDDEHPKKVTKLLSLQNKSRRALNRLSEIAQEDKNMSLHRSIVKEIENEAKKAQLGYLDRVCSLLEADEEAMKLRLEVSQVPKDMRKAFRDEKEYLRDVISKLQAPVQEDEKRQKVLDYLLIHAEKPGDVHAHQSALEFTAEKEVNKKLDQVTKETAPEPKPMLQLGLLKKKAKNPKKVKKRVQLQKIRIKPKTPHPTERLVMWTDEVEAYKMDHPEVRLPQLTPREKLDKKREINNLYSPRKSRNQ